MGSRRGLFHNPQIGSILAPGPELPSQFVDRAQSLQSIDGNLVSRGTRPARLSLDPETRFPGGR